MTSGRHLRKALVGGAALAVMVGGAAVGVAHAQGRLEARYSATLAGMPFGKGTWTLDVG